MATIPFPPAGGTLPEPSDGDTFVWNERTYTYNLNQDTWVVNFVNRSAPLDSPAFTGIPTAPAPLVTANNATAVRAAATATQLATLDFVVGEPKATVRQTPDPEVAPTIAEFLGREFVVEYE